jgi:hypothetical protein
VARRRFTVEQIIGKLREAEVAIGKGLTVPQASRQIGVTEQAYTGGGRSTAACALTKQLVFERWRREISDSRGSSQIKR